MIIWIFKLINSIKISRVGWSGLPLVPHDHQDHQVYHQDDHQDPDDDHLSQRLLSSAGLPLAARSRANLVSGSLASVPKVTLNCYCDDDENRLRHYHHLHHQYHHYYHCLSHQYHDHHLMPFPSDIDDGRLRLALRQAPHPVKIVLPI